MRGFKWAIARLAIAIIFGLVTFWPTYGLVFIAVQQYQHLLPVAICAAIWMTIFFLLLPVPLWMFGRVSTAMLFAIYVLIFFTGVTAKTIDPSQASFWLTWGVGALFSLIGWLMVATPLWRLFHGVVAVQQTGAEEEHHQ